MMFESFKRENDEGEDRGFGQALSDNSLSLSLSTRSRSDVAYNMDQLGLKSTKPLTMWREPVGLALLNRLLLDAFRL